MKIIALEISIEHVPNEAEEVLFGESAVATETTGPHQENFRFSISQELADDEPAIGHIERIATELMRRYRTLNARKTN